MNLADRYRTDSEVTFQKMEDETVIVHLGTGRIHHTNSTGSRVWELLHAGRSLEEIVQILCREFDVSEDQLRREVTAFVEQLAQEQMIRPVERAA